MMSATYEPQPINVPDLERDVAAHLRSRNAGPGLMVGRRFPATLPTLINGVTFSTALVIRDDGGPWPNRTLSVSVVGAKDASYESVRGIAAWVAAEMATAADRLPFLASVAVVRGPLSVADNPPEFQIVSDLILVG